MLFPQDVVFEYVKEDINDEDFLSFNGTTFLYDFEKGDFVLQDGNPIVQTDKDAIKIWVEKNIRTRFERFEIYNSKMNIQREYGSNIPPLILGKKMPRLLIEAELQRDIQEMCSENYLIKRTEDFHIFFEGTTLFVFFTIVLQTGEEVRIEGVEVSL